MQRHGLSRSQGAELELKVLLPALSIIFLEGGINQLAVPFSARVQHVRECEDESRVSSGLGFFLRGSRCGADDSSERDGSGPGIGGLYLCRSGHRPQCCLGSILEAGRETAWIGGAPRRRENLHWRKSLPFRRTACDPEA